MLRALRGEVGGWTVRGMVSQVLALLLFRRLGEIAAKIDRLTVRFQAGRLWRHAPRVTIEAGEVAETARRHPRGRRLWPGRFAWLVRAAGYQAAGYGCQLRHILEQPEMVALLQASPQAARILRPVCRMLAIETALLRPGVAVPEPLPRVRKPRLRKPRVPIDWGRIPLPRGVLSAARRAGFGKLR